MSRVIYQYVHPEPDLHDQVMAELRARPEAQEAMALLRRSRDPDARFLAGDMSWQDTLSASIADAAAVANSTAEAIMVPDWTINAGLVKQNETYRYRLWGKISTVITTPGTIIHRLRWGGVGGTLLAASGAYAPDPTAASTDLTFKVEWDLTFRSVGSAGSAICFGERNLQDFDDATVTTLKGNLDMLLMPVSSPAAVGSLDTLTNKALSPTVQFSVLGAGTTQTVMLAILESLN